MLRTIQVGSCVSIQGIFVGLLTNGLIQIRDGDGDGKANTVSDK